ncbi:MAG: tRNA pseudouridine(38-40) synthase TruA, partial [Spirochaetales bacterium]|nr:tRNA pseudouridine(38-40) synthase TruA [Spirochaetales bacterium]
MKRYKLTIAYDGTDFCGWQIQKNGRSVQQEIEKILKQIHNRKISLTGSGRTDAGVHARGQVAHFDADGNIPQERYVPALNTRLCDDIRIIKSEIADDDFHARYSAVSRCYKYYLSQDRYPDIFRRKYCIGAGRTMDLELLNSYAGKITGIHDFSTFSAAGDKSKSKVREIFEASF